MKRKIVTVLFLLIMVFTVGCNKDKKNDPTPTPTTVPTATSTPTPVPVNLAMQNLEKLVSDYDAMLEKQPNSRMDFSNGIGYDMTLDITPGKQIIELFGISGLDSVRLSGTIDAKDTVSANLGLYLNSSEIVKALVFMDDNNLLFNLPKYTADFASYPLEELMNTVDTSFSGSFGTLTDTMNPAKSMNLSEELTNVFRTHLVNLVNTFVKVDGVTKNASIGTGEYTVTGDLHKVTANVADVITVLKAFEADMIKYYGEMDFGLTDLENSAATALVLDYYIDEAGNYAWAYYTDDAPDKQIIFINTDLGFCLYQTTNGQQTIVMASVKDDEKSGTIYLYSSDEVVAAGEIPEETGYIDYEYEENSIYVDIEYDTMEIELDCSIENDIVNYEVTLIMDGMTFIIEEKASKENIEATLTLASYGIEYATVNVDMAMRDYVETPLPANAVDIETWSAGLDPLALLTDLANLLQEYPFLATLLGLAGGAGGYGGY